MISNQCLPAASPKAPAESCPADGIKRIETYIDWLLLHDADKGRPRCNVIDLRPLEIEEKNEDLERDQWLKNFS